MAGTLDVGDARIVYSDEGGGRQGSGGRDPVLLLHGSFTPDWLTPVGRHLVADGRRVLNVQRAGYGRSQDLAGNVSVAAHAGHAVAVLEAVGVRRADLVGHSSGAAVALQLAATRTDMARTLVLLDAAFPYAPDEPAHPAMPHALQAAADGDYPRAFDLFLGGVGGPGFREVFVRELGEDGLRQAVEGSRYFFTTEGPALRAWPFGAAQGAAVTAPVLLAVGGESERLGTAYRARAARLAAWLPDSEVRPLPGLSHAAPLEDPAAVARIVEEFTARHGA